VTHVADYGVTFVDIGGFEAMINIPELSWRPISHPSDIVSVGQEINAEILDVGPIRERVSLSLKACTKIRCCCEPSHVGEPVHLGEPGAPASET
jgi:ribosomal protein S1